MYAKPNPKKLAWEREQREAQQREQREVESCYRQHRTGQQRYAAWRERVA